MMSKQNVPELRFPEFSGEWEQVKLKDIVEPIKGNDGVLKDTPIMTISAKRGWLDQKERFSQVIAGNSLGKYTLLRKNDLSYNKGNSKAAKYGIVYRNTHDRALVPNVYKSFRGRDDVSSKFLELYFHTFKLDRQLRKLITSTARMDGLLNISDNDFYNIQMYFPSKNEQEKIGSFFSKLDRLIELEEKKLELLEAQKKGYMQKIFSQELRFKDESGNDYPEWGETQLSNLITEVVEKTTSSNQYELISSTKNGLYKQAEYFKKQVASKDNKGYKIIRLNNIIISPQNLWLGNINFNDKYEVGIVSPSYRTFKVENISSFHFLKHLLKTKRYLYEYEQASEQGASIVRRNLNMDLFYDISVKIPVKEERIKIGSLLDQMDKRIDSQQKKLDILNERKKSLLKKMFV